MPVRDTGSKPHQMHCHSPQPIKDASFELAGSIVHVTRSPPQQPTELIYCTASVCIPKRKGEYLHRRYVNLSLTCLNPTDPEDDMIAKTDIRPLCTSARAATLCRSSYLGLATRKCESWVMSPIYKLMNDTGR